MTRSNEYLFFSDDEYFIGIDGMRIYNDRNSSDLAYLNSSYWSGILVGTDGYPTTNKYGDYCIGGGKNAFFKATAIEFYGIKTNGSC